jgi:gamma-glutamyl:cysteine ligase YbdK (ATP-grasp superfamily)
VIVTAWNNTDNSHDVETTHSHRSRRVNAYDSMENAAQEACLYYHGRRVEAMKENRYRFLPCYDHVKRTWAVLAPSATDPTMDTMVKHLCAMHETNEALKEELRATQKSKKRLQKQIDEMAV